MHKDEIIKLKHYVNALSLDDISELCYEVENSYEPLLAWCSYFSSYHQADNELIIISSIYSSIRETAACLALGLKRMALLSMRTQVDLSLAWIFFKDHPVEWNHINQTGKDFRLKKDIFQYLSTYVDGFQKRIGLLNQIKSRRVADPYSLLSAHIHGQSELTLPLNYALSDVAVPIEDLQECAHIASDLTEFVSDVFLASNFWNFHSLPISIQTSLTQRFVSDAQQAEYFNA